MPNNVTVYVMTVWQNLPSKNTALEATNLNHLEQGIKNVTDFVNTINATSGLYLSQTPFTTALKNKLDGIEAQANKYVLPTASNSTLGGVKVDAETITIDQNGVIHAAAAATQLSALTDVNLEDLADGQILKYDATAGKWVNTSEAEVRTQLSLLEDVDIDENTLADGDALRYNGSTEKWENGPAGDVLDYDETLQVLGDPAEDFNTNHRTLLWGSSTIAYPATRPSDAQLNDDYKNFDEIEIVCGWATDNIFTIVDFFCNADILYNTDNTSYTATSKHVLIHINGHEGQWIRAYKGSADNIIHFEYETNKVGIYQIYGIKY